MKISVDCRHIDSSGIGVYARECLSFLLNSSNRFYLFGDPEKLKFAANKQNVKIIPCTIKPFSLRETFAFPVNFLEIINNGDLYYSPYFNVPSGIKVPVYTTIHDIIFPDMPELTSFIGLKIRMWFYRRSFRLSRKIFTVSQFSKSRIEHYAENKVPVIVTYNAIQSYFFSTSSQNENTSNKKPEKNDFILFVGNIKKHKGLGCLLDAFFEARNCGLKQRLLIVGSSGNFRSKDDAFNEKLSLFKNNEVHFTGSIPDIELKRLYSEASLLVQPSLYEGFGIPPLEAMYSGTLPLISDIPVFNEIYGEFPVVFFKTGDSVDLKEKLLSLLLNKEAPKITLNDNLLNRYSYKLTAEIILREISA